MTSIEPRVSWQPTTSVRSYDSCCTKRDVEDDGIVNDEALALLAPAPPSSPTKKGRTASSAIWNRHKKKLLADLPSVASFVLLGVVVVTVSLYVCVGGDLSSYFTSSSAGAAVTTQRGESAELARIQTSSTGIPGMNPENDDVQKIVYIIRHGEKHRDPNNATAYLYACLSDKGYERADHLIETFITQNTQNLIVPAALFSFNYDNGDVDCRDPIDHIYRTQATLRPLGKVLDITIDNLRGAKPDLCGSGTIEDRIGITDSDTKLIDYNHKVCDHPKMTGSVHDFGNCCNLEAAEAIRRQLFVDPTTSSSVFVAWEHANIGYLAESLMIDTMDDYEQQVIGSYLSTNPAFQEMMYWPDSNFDEILTMWFDPITQKFLKIDTDSYVQGFGDWRCDTIWKREREEWICISRRQQSKKKK